MLTNYWWLLIWMFTGAILIENIFPRRKEIIFGREELRWTPFAAILMVLPYIIWTGYRGDNFGDTYAYRTMFQGAPTALGDLYSYVADAKKDKGFSALTVILKTIIGNADIVFFMILAIVQMLCLVYVYRKYSCNYWLSIFIFIASTDYLSWMHNGVRQFLAASLIFASSGLILKKKYVGAIVIVLLAATFHGSALLMLPGIFIIQGKAWNKKTMLVILASLAAIMMIDRFTGILDNALQETQYSNMVTDWKEWQDNGTSPLRVLVYSVPTILAFIGRKWIKQADDPMINLSVNAAICSSGLYAISMVSSGIFIGRLPIYFSMWANGVLLPWEIRHFFNQESQRWIYMATIVAYAIFFYYQMHNAWGLL